MIVEEIITKKWKTSGFFGVKVKNSRREFPKNGANLIFKRKQASNVLNLLIAFYASPVRTITRLDYDSFVKSFRNSAKTNKYFLRKSALL